MCGIVGFAGFIEPQKTLEAASDVITHRGPDDSGMFLEGDIGLAMRRLSIIDLECGKQPQFNDSKDSVIVYNGELYNYQEIKKELIEKGYKFQTKSDTEVILRSFEEYGEKCLEKFNGMFSFAIYSKSNQKMFVARDRLGIKPLYLWRQGNQIIFASELKSILEFPRVKRDINLKCLDAFISLRYVPGEETMIKGIKKFPAGHFMWWSPEGVVFKKYWEASFVKKHYNQVDPQLEFERLFEESVRKRLISDVPLGAFLSGGLDSSAIVVAMSKFQSIPTQTYTVGFDWEGDEVDEAEYVAKTLGCEHKKIICSKDNLTELPNIIWNLDEPIGDGIVLPMYLLSRYAQKDVKVILSGEGADEVLAGYFPHKVMVYANIYRKLIPAFLRKKVIPFFVSKFPSSLLNVLFDYPAKLGERGKKKLLDYLNIICEDNLLKEYRHLTSLFDYRDKKLLYSKESELSSINLEGSKYVNMSSKKTKGEEFLDDVLGLQYADWLPDDILNKADKMLMANSVEGRVPFMDHELVEFLNASKSKHKMNFKKNKILLRNYLKKNLPESVAKRKKKPFYIPLDKLMSDDFQKLLNDCLNEESVKKRGYFNWDYVKFLMNSMGKGEFIYDKQVFSLLVLEIWHRIFIDNDKSILT